MTTPAHGAIAVEGLRYVYPDGTTALHEVDLSIEPGESVALVGPNGAGKSTLLLHLDGVLAPTSGTVRIDELQLGPATVAEVRTRVGFVFQDPDDQLFSPTVRDDVAYGPRHMGLEPDEVAGRVDVALRAVDMAGSEDRPPHHLSMGQRKRVSLATVLSMEPSILVFDEPTAGLDPRGRDAVAALITARTETRLMSSHDMALVAAVAERIVILDEGSVVEDGPADEVLGDVDLLRRHGLEAPCDWPGPAGGSDQARGPFNTTR